MKIFIFFGIFGLSAAVHFSDKPCPQRPVMKDYNFTALAGEWYDIKKYSNIYDQGFECSHTMMNLVGENLIEATRCEKINQQRNCIKYNVQNNDGSFLITETSGRKNFFLS